MGIHGQVHPARPGEGQGRLPGGMQGSQSNSGIRCEGREEEGDRAGEVGRAQVRRLLGPANQQQEVMLKLCRGKTCQAAECSVDPFNWNDSKGAPTPLKGSLLCSFQSLPSLLGNGGLTACLYPHSGAAVSATSRFATFSNSEFHPARSQICWPGGGWCSRLR